MKHLPHWGCPQNTKYSYDQDKMLSPLPMSLFVKFPVRSQTRPWVLGGEVVQSQVDTCHTPVSQPVVQNQVDTCHTPASQPVVPRQVDTCHTPASQPSQTASSTLSERPCFKNKVKINRSKYLMPSSGLHMHTYGHVPRPNTHTQTHPT